MSPQSVVIGRVIPPADVFGSAQANERSNLLSLPEQSAGQDYAAARADAVLVTLENVTASQAPAVDLDDALRTVRLIRNGILDHVPASISAIANQSPRSVLSLLG